MKYIQAFISIFIVFSVCTQFVASDEIYKAESDAANPVVINNSNGLPVSVFLHQPLSLESMVLTQEGAASQLKEFFREYHKSYGIENSADMADLTLISIKGDIKNGRQLNIHRETHRLPAVIAKWEQKFMGVPVLNGTIAASFVNSNLYSVSGTFHSKQELSRRYIEKIKNKRLISNKEAESVALKYLSGVFSNESKVFTSSQLVLDLGIDNPAYLVDVNEYIVFVDAVSGKAYYEESRRANWWWNWRAEESAVVRAFELPDNRAHFIINEQKYNFADGAVDRKRKFWPWECLFRTSHGAEEGTKHLISRFPYPTTYQYRSDGTHDTLVREGPCRERNALTADAGAEFWVQNTHYRISKAARTAVKDWRMHLFADWAPDRTWPLHVELHYQDGTGGADINLMELPK